MKIEALKNLVTSKTARQVLLLRKNSPRIMFVAGAVGVVGATVLACRATLKVSDVLDVFDKDRLLLLDDAVGNDGISDDQLQSADRKLKLKTAVEITKLYALPVGLLVVSVGALTGSHVILDKRNSALMATYAGLDQAYKRYRQRVAEEFGEETDRKFASGAHDVLVEEKMADGTVKTSIKTVVGKEGASPYAVLFDETSHKFTREPGMNAMIVGMQQSHANDKLRANGHLFLNEVKDMLGLPRTFPEGAIVGWVYRHDNEEKTGDNYVDFGVFEGDKERADAFVNGDELAVWLDFNVDGVIYDKI
jgi:uncharacterized protein DUF6353